MAVGMDESRDKGFGEWEGRRWGSVLSARPRSLRAFFLDIKKWLSVFKEGIGMT